MSKVTKSILNFDIKSLLLCLIALVLVIAFTLTKDVSTVAISKDEASKFKILIDAGHGGFDNGALAKFEDKHEAQLNLEIALKLKVELENIGYSVSLTREDENALSATKNGDMARRKAIIKDSNADMLVSIHMNSNKDSSISGPICYFMPGSISGEELAKEIQNTLNDDLSPKKPKKIQSQNYFVLRAGDMPSVLVECGFISNKAEEKKLNNKSYQDKIAKAVAKGISNYLYAKL